MERRQNATSTTAITTENAENQQSPIEISPESVDRVKVILLGAPAVGKTSILQVSSSSSNKFSGCNKRKGMLFIIKTRLVKVSFTTRKKRYRIMYSGYPINTRLKDLSRKSLVFSLFFSLA